MHNDNDLHSVGSFKEILCGVENLGEFAKVGIGEKVVVRSFGQSSTGGRVLIESSEGFLANIIWQEDGAVTLKASEGDGIANICLNG